MPLLFDMGNVLLFGYPLTMIISLFFQMVTVFPYEMSKQKLICTCAFFAISSFAIVEEMGSSPLQISQINKVYGGPRLTHILGLGKNSVT
jgi:hypothetical protein